MLKAINAQPTKRMRWTPRLIKQLRGKRTLAEFGALIGAPKNTVWRWEAGQSQPDSTYVELLSDLAQRERFLNEWRLAGSMKLSGDLERAKSEIADLFRSSIERSTRQLTK